MHNPSLKECADEVCTHDYGLRVICRLDTGTSNKLQIQFPVAPESVQQLTGIEERRVAPRHIFQTIWPVMGRYGQLSTCLPR